MAQRNTAARTSIVEVAPRQVAALHRFSATGLEPTLAHLVELRAINAWNRLQIATKAEPGHYEAGNLEREAAGAGAGAKGGES